MRRRSVGAVSMAIIPPLRTKILLSEMDSGNISCCRCWGHQQTFIVCRWPIESVGRDDAAATAAGGEEGGGKIPRPGLKIPPPGLNGAVANNPPSSVLL